MGFEENGAGGCALLSCHGNYFVGGLLWLLFGGMRERWNDVTASSRWHLAA